MIQFACPCGKALHARDEFAGQTTRCPACGRELDIPGEGVQTADAPRAAGSPADEGVRRARPDRSRGAEWEDRPRPPTTSGMAVASLVLGVLSLLCSLLSGLPAIVLGVIALVDIGRSEGRKKGKGLAITGVVAGLLGVVALPILLTYGYFKVREAAARMSCSNNLMQIGLAMHSYDQANGTFPAAAICDPMGKPLLSWRVALLPYVGGDSLYNQFKLDEPWDGPNNRMLLSSMPKVYALPGDTTAPPGYTYYRVFVGNHAAFDWNKGAQMPADFPDGTSNTILVAEAGQAVPWTKPDELDYDPNGPLPALGGHYSTGFMVGLADGSVRMISKDVNEQTLRNAITRDDGMPLGPDW